MALRKLAESESPWLNPHWPNRLPIGSKMRLSYGFVADELVVRFDERHETDEVVVVISTPGEDYAGLIVEMNSGKVIGVHVYPLLAIAAQRHPAWKAAGVRSPAPEVAARIVTDVRTLFDRYGISPEPVD